MKHLWVQAFILSSQLILDSLVDVRSFKHSFVWGLWLAVYPFVRFRSLLAVATHDTFFLCLQLEARLEEIKVEP